MLWDITISKSLDRYLQRVKVNGARKSLFTLSVTLAFTRANEQMPRQERVAHDRMGKMAAEWHRVGLERPHFCTRFRAQSEPWVAPANKKLPSVRAVRIWAKQVKKVGITYFSFVFTIFFSL
jgi:hypothetical protein